MPSLTTSRDASGWGRRRNTRKRTRALSSNQLYVLYAILQISISVGFPFFVVKDPENKPKRQNVSVGLLLHFFKNSIPWSVELVLLLLVTWQGRIWRDAHSEGSAKKQAEKETVTEQSRKEGGRKREDGRKKLKVSRVHPNGLHSFFKSDLEMVPIPPGNHTIICELSL